MASLATVCRLSARLTARKVRQDSTKRGFRKAAVNLAAHNFTMPALSPTMTEGNIAKWAVKEGDSFSAGDVLLEIETDKASMDVEAQDDGIMAKIMQGDGTKAIQVGARIAVIADAGDDISALEIPADENAPASKKEASQQKEESPSQVEAPPTSKLSTESTPAKSSKKAEKQTYPLLPSVEHLMHSLNIPMSAIDSMTPSGPKNRLLKGDVLAYIGNISSSYPTELSTKINKLSHLDLSNIKLAAPAPAPKASVTEPTAAPPVATIPDSRVALPISMKAVIEVQRRIESTLGVFMPLSTFISRATDMANDNLPRSKTAPPTADELFNSILGLENISSSMGVRGTFLPQITALSSSVPRSRVPKQKSADIIDILAAPSKRTPSKGLGMPMPGMSGEVNVFSVTVPKGDEKRAEVFLERVKMVLESEPGRLVL